MKWTAVCPECGARETTTERYTVDEAQKWANCWLQKHWEVCGERKARGQEEA